MSDVAARVGVSRALVSLVFRNAPGASLETRERVFRAAAELGYRPDLAARLLARGRSRVLGVLFTVRNPFHVDVVETIYPAAEELGYDIVLSAHVPSRDENQAIEALIGHRSEALILLGPIIPARDVAELGRRVPTVVVGRKVSRAPVDIVTTRDRPGVGEVVDYLIGLGHRDIVHVDGGSGPGSAERRRAYRDFMRKRGLAERVRVIGGDQTEESGAAAARTLLAEPRLPTAVFAGNDLCAIGLLDVFTRAGVSVPEDVSIVGYDDSHIAGLSHIDLTTVRQDVGQLAELAVRAADAQLSGSREAGVELLLDSRMVVRGTTAPPRS
ncbi:LacI family DNA-binding transcriptional regulator [Stackebrandtia nassauensis]|uniref:Transcriptional regulator, LacI family n=1 Tax=Stackebrandtia nassauensis (strain DSM 44728 / CIP 108903 / NRRL B-16338 / NBRC 102104 / LLR-40K-21) TaxID=446470 RepID=D3Q6X7_STANL|nr:LacI family DNA-binding transcriptional regulator [Stackebrandtia nassauensis]ADD40376.1 transcriptional regulator, LacI family [Stackebrandtia nassauensis DSM 44728]